MSGAPTQRFAEEIVVVGGGIGGLTAALALAQDGRRVRVLERAPHFAEVGAGLQLAPNATRLLRRLGLLDRVLQVGVVPARLVFADALTGEGLSTTDLGPRFQSAFGAPYVVVHRADLLDALIEGARSAGVTLETNCEVTGVESLEHLARVSCADGSVYEARAVIGADGLRSALRTGFDQSPPRYSGYLAYRGAIPTADVDRPHDLDTVIAWIGPGLHLVQYPVRGGELYNQVAVFRCAAEPSPDAPSSLRQLREAFAGTCDPVQRALPSLETNFQWPVYDREPLQRWTLGRVALLGDAAHPSVQYLAQGACQAIEDAVTLADQMCLHDDPAGPDQSSGIERALGAYEFIRQPRTARVQNTARLWGEVWHLQDPIARAVRNELFRRVPDDDLSYAEWLWSWSPPKPRSASSAARLR